MKKKGIVCVLGIFFCLCFMRCDIYSTTNSKNIRYTFPEKTLISQIDENCLTEAGGESVNKGSKLEKAFLAVLTEEIPVEKQKKAGDSLHQAPNRLSPVLTVCLTYPNHLSPVLTVSHLS